MEPLAPTAEFPDDLFKKVLDETIIDFKSAILPLKMLLLLGVLVKHQKNGQMNATGRYKMTVKFSKLRYRSLLEVMI
jgi:hypothetical protein